MAAKPLPWHDLQTFLAAARGGTLLAAARALDTSAATVMRQLRVLERALNTSLFSRSSRGYALTPAGRELLEHALAIEAEVLAAERRVSGGDQRVIGTIRVAALDDLVQTMLGKIFAGFTQRHPQLCLDLLIESERTNLARRSADVAFRAGAQPSDPDVVARRVATMGIALYASRAYLHQCGPLASLEELPGHRLVRGDEARAGMPMEKLVDRHAPGTLAVLRSSSMLARVVAVREGVGVGLLPCFIADAEPGLVRIGEVIPEASVALWILIHPDLRRNARIRAFVDYTHAELTRFKARLAGEG